MQVICDRSSHLILFDIIKLCPSAIYSEKILQRLATHLKSLFCYLKLLISVFSLGLVNNRSKFFGYFCERIKFLFLNILKDTLIEYLTI